MRSDCWVGIAKRGEIWVSQSGSDMELGRGRGSRKRIGRVDEGWSSGGVQLGNEDSRGREGIRTGGRRREQGLLYKHKDSRKKGRRLRPRLGFHQPTAITDIRFRSQNLL